MIDQRTPQSSPKDLKSSRERRWILPRLRSSHQNLWEVRTRARPSGDGFAKCLAETGRRIRRIRRSRKQPR